MAQGATQVLDQDALDLVQTDGVIGAVIQLGGARRLVIREVLSVLNRTTILQVVMMLVARNVWQKEAL